jgi:hypothetical protein
MEKKIRFMRHYVTDGETKAKVHYSAGKVYTDPQHDKTALAVTLYEQGYNRNLFKIFGSEGYKNETDSQSDYFDEGNVKFFEDHPLYQEALNRANAIEVERNAKWAKKHPVTA